MHKGSVKLKIALSLAHEENFVHNLSSITASWRTVALSYDQHQVELSNCVLTLLLEAGKNCLRMKSHSENSYYESGSVLLLQFNTEHFI